MVSLLARLEGRKKGRHSPWLAVVGTAHGWQGIGLGQEVGMKVGSDVSL